MTVLDGGLVVDYFAPYQRDGKTEAIIGPTMTADLLFFGPTRLNENLFFGVGTYSQSLNQRMPFPTNLQLSPTGLYEYFSMLARMLRLREPASQPLHTIPERKPGRTPLPQRIKDSSAILIQESHLSPIVIS